MENKFCRYCKKNGHLKTECPELYCKKCSTFSHPTWKCKEKKTPIMSINNEKLFNYLSRKDIEWHQIDYIY